MPIPIWKEMMPTSHSSGSATSATPKRVIIFLTLICCASVQIRFCSNKINSWWGTGQRGSHNTVSFATLSSSASIMSRSTSSVQQLHPNLNVTTTGVVQEQEATGKEVILPFSPLELIPIEDLLNTAPNYTCPDGQLKVTDKILPTSVTHANRKIPRIIHLKANHRCVPPFMMEHINENWRERFVNHTFLLWDDYAVDKMLSMPVVERIFPNLPSVISCAVQGATRCDLWRYAALYFYGGVYSDLDNKARPKLDLNTLIQPNDTAFATIEKLGIPSQYFLAAAPGDPWMYYSLKSGLMNLYETDNVMVNNPHLTTGPSAIKKGFIDYQQAINITSSGYVTQGIYEGDYFCDDRVVCTKDDEHNVQHVALNSDTNSSSNHPWRIRLVGRRQQGKQYVNRGGLGGEKKRAYYNQSGLDFFYGIHKDYPNINTISCAEHIARQEAMWNGSVYKRANYQFVNGTYMEVNQY